MISPRRLTTNALLSGACTIALTVTLTVLANAQTAPETAVLGTHTDVSTTAGLAESTSSSIAPLISSFQPTTPWPPHSYVSESTLTHQPDLLAYTGIDAQARKLLDSDYTQWVSHFSGNTPAKPLSGGLLMASACLTPNCDVRKSLLIVDPMSQKVFAAMVTEGKVAMWPSLMSWPDQSIPTLKSWLAAATDGADDESSSTKPKPAAN